MSERELFSLGPATGTGKEKRRNLRKTIPVQTCCTRNAWHYTEESFIQLIITVRAEYVSRELIMIFSAFCRFFKKEILTRLRKTKLCD